MVNVPFEGPRLANRGYVLSTPNAAERRCLFVSRFHVVAFALKEGRVLCGKRFLFFLCSSVSLFL